MRKTVVLGLTLCLLLSGCNGLFDSSYIYQTPHQEESSKIELDSVYAKNYDELCQVLVEFAQTGTKEGIVFIPEYDQTQVEADMERAIQQTLEKDPIAAYAVESVQWELGTNSGLNAIALDITFIHDKAELKKIREVADLDSAKKEIAAALDNCDAGVVLYVEKYQSADFAQIVEDYADANPNMVMETPQTAVNVYPETGKARVVEIKFTYQNSRDALRTMQGQISPVFRSAVLYVSGDAEDNRKLSQLFSFLMERFDYKLETSITPSYSLLRHGVGDAKAFAVVYAAMCRAAGLNCQVVTGTRAGEPWYWNLVEDNGTYFHVDLLQSSADGAFTEKTDDMMAGYVWDYSEYPASRLPEPPPESQPQETQTPETE